LCAEVYNTTYSEQPHHLKHVPGYTGFVPGVEAENIYARTYGHATNTAIGGDHARYQWRIQHKDERFLTTHQTAHRNFGHPGLVEDKHVTYGHQDANPNRTSYRLKAAPPLTTDEQPHHLPGYGGFVPGVYAKNSYGKSIYQTTTEALHNHKNNQADLTDNKPKSAPDMGLAKVDEVRMMFKPAGYLFQKRMQGEWNNGRLGAKNMSAIRFEDRSHWGPELLAPHTRRISKGMRLTMCLHATPSTRSQSSKTWTRRRVTRRCIRATSHCEAALVAVAEARSNACTSLGEG